MVGPQRTGRVAIGDLDMSFETHGEGPPVVLIHGGVAASAGLEPTIDSLSTSRSVIVPHLQAHGHTPDIDRPLRYETLADYVAALLDHLGIARAGVVGYSLGGGVGLQLAIRHPARVERLVVVSEPMRRDGWFPEVLAQLDTMEASAAQIGPHLAAGPLAARYPGVDWTGLFRRMGEMEARDYDWEAGVRELTMPVMLVFADGDAVTPKHMLAFWRAIGGGLRDAGLDGSERPAGQLAIVPGRTHYDLMRDDTVARLVAPFLDAASPLPHSLGPDDRTTA